MQQVKRKSPAPPRSRPALGETQLRALTVNQIETAHPGTKGRVRGWIHRADSGDPEFAWLRQAVIRIGRSVFVDELRFVEGLRQRSVIPPAPDRRGGWVRNGN